MLDGVALPKVRPHPIKEVANTQSYPRTVDLHTFKVRFSALRDEGFVKSRRRGDTGVGHTLEKHLGILENNISLPDLTTAELKAKRENASSRITLLTRDRKAWQLKQRHAIEKFGVSDDEGRPGLYYTLSATTKTRGFSVVNSRTEISVEHRSGSVLATWRHDVLADAFKKKFPALLLVTAKSEIRQDGEWFHYNSAKLLSGASANRFYSCIAAGHISIDLRLHLEGRKVRNHGTAFRIPEVKLPNLFTSSRAI